MLLRHMLTLARVRSAFFSCFTHVRTRRPPSWKRLRFFLIDPEGLLFSSSSQLAGFFVSQVGGTSALVFRPLSFAHSLRSSTQWLQKPLIPIKGIHRLVFRKYITPLQRSLLFFLLSSSEGAPVLNFGLIRESEQCPRPSTPAGFTSFPRRCPGVKESFDLAGSFPFILLAHPSRYVYLFTRDWMKDFLFLSPPPDLSETH